MLEQIRQAIEQGEYEYYGIRVDDGVDYKLGDQAADSRIWIDGDATEDTLDGTSCIGIRSEDGIETALQLADAYYGDRVYLIGGNSMTYGEDAGEYVIQDATVVAIPH